MSCCSPCAAASQARATFVGDPIARKLAGVGRSGQTMGRIGVWPSDVVDLKRRLDPSMRATDAAVRSCAGISTGERDAWSDFFKAWSEFRDQDVPWFGSGAKYDEADSYRVQLGGWQEQLSGRCSVPGPKVSTEPEGEITASAIKWGAAAVIAASLVYGLRTVLR